jgi:DNA polymerase III subunit beta
MKLSLLQENLNIALSSVSRFVSLKAQLPILSNILFSTDSGRLKLSATNLELGINYWLGAKIDTEGSFTLPAKEITEFISYLPVGRLNLELNPQSLLEIVSSKAQSTFTTIPAADFPTLPSLNDKTALEIDLKILSETISQVAFAAATDDSRPILTAVLCRFTPTTLSLVATDGFRLSLKEIKLVNPITLPESKDNLTFLIPSRSLMEVAKLAKSTPRLKFGLSSDAHQLIFVLEDLELVSRLIEGDYPDYQRIIPDSFTTTVHLDKNEFAQAVKIASVFARESANVVKLSVKNSSLDVSANATQIGQNKASVDAKVDGEPLEIAFNYKFISDFLSVCQGNEVVIKLNEPLTPGLFCDEADPHFTHIIMPVRIQD